MSGSTSNKKTVQIYPLMGFLGYLFHSKSLIEASIRSTCQVLKTMLEQILVGRVSGWAWQSWVCTRWHKPTKPRRDQGIVRSEKRCHYILGLLYSAWLRLGSQNLTHNPCPPTVVDWIMYTAQWTLSQIPGSSFELAEYIKPKIQWRHLFADRTIPHLWFQVIYCSALDTQSAGTVYARACGIVVSMPCEMRSSSMYPFY
jgi:hypothetical protein